jgi:hypothetical protein
MHFAYERISQNKAYEESLKKDEEREEAAALAKALKDVAEAEAAAKTEEPKDERLSVKELRAARLAFYSSNLKP